MKKILIIFSIFFVIIANIKNNDESMTVMNVENIQSNHYELIFDNNRNFRNFKLKLASLTS